MFGFAPGGASACGMAKNPRLGFRPSLAARAAAAREAAKATTVVEAAVNTGAREESRELRICGIAAVQARFARDPGSVLRLF